MKKIFIFCVIFLGGLAAFSQKDSNAPYQKNKTLPNFVLLNADSAVFSQKVLTGNKHTIIMLFSPVCEHCQQQLELLLSLPQVINNTNLILTSTEPLHKLKLFSDKYQLQKYPWIHLGKDHKYFFGGFFQPKTIPVLAFYNKQNQLSYFNQGNVKKKEILLALKK